MLKSIQLKKYEHTLAKKYAQHGAYLVQVKIGGAWVTKCFLKRCPECGKALSGMISAEGWEYCVESACHYQRIVYTYEESKALAAEFASHESAFRRSPKPLLDSYS